MIILRVEAFFLFLFVMLGLFENINKNAYEDFWDLFWRIPDLMFHIGYVSLCGKIPKCSIQK